MRGDENIDIFGPAPLIGYDGPVRGLELKYQEAADSARAIAHLFRFEQILNLRHKISKDNPPFEVILEPESRGISGTPFREEESLTYTFKNNSDTELYFTVMTLSLGFHVKQLFPEWNYPATMPKGTSRSFDFSLHVPDNLKGSGSNAQDHTHRDIIRTVVTQGEGTSLKSLELPDIWETFDPLKSRYTYTGGLRRYASLVTEKDVRWWIQDDVMLIRED